MKFEILTIHLDRWYFPEITSSIRHWMGEREARGEKRRCSNLFRTNVHKTWNTSKCPNLQIWWRRWRRRRTRKQSGARPILILRLSHSMGRRDTARGRRRRRPPPSAADGVFRLVTNRTSLPQSIKSVETNARPLTFLLPFLIDLIKTSDGRNGGSPQRRAPYFATNQDVTDNRLKWTTSNNSNGFLYLESWFKAINSNRVTSLESKYVN